MNNTISRRDLKFPVYEVLAIDKLYERDYFSGHGRDTFGLSGHDGSSGCCLVRAETGDCRAQRPPDAHAADKDFYRGKMQAQAKLLSTLDTTCLDMPEVAFAC